MLWMSFASRNARQAPSSRIATSGAHFTPRPLSPFDLFNTHLLKVAIQLSRMSAERLRSASRFGSSSEAIATIRPFSTVHAIRLIG